MPSRDLLDVIRADPMKWRGVLWDDLVTALRRKGFQMRATRHGALVSDIPHVSSRE